jgi:VWFA-related protein
VGQIVTVMNEKRTPVRPKGFWALVLCTAALGAILCAAAAAKQTGTAQQHESVVINIEVPVRVMKGNVFVDGLTLEDFEVYENGVLQPIEAVYLVEDKKVLREEKVPESAAQAPRTARHFILYLGLKEYLPKINKALDHFFNDVIGIGDTLFVVTPAKSYRFKREALSRVSRDQIAEQLKAKLRADIQTGTSDYRKLMRDFYYLEETPYPSEMAEVKETMLFELATQMRDRTKITEGSVMGFADALKSLEGEKHVFLIFQKDVLPDHEFSEERHFELIKPVTFDVDKVKEYFADASITIHFLYITKTPSFALNPMSPIHTVRPSLLNELSTDIYASFREIAVATGGLTESTGNPDFALRKAAEASSRYYLLYYRPLNARADGRFRKFEVRIKGGNYKVIHRLGYIAD